MGLMSHIVSQELGKSVLPAEGAAERNVDVCVGAVDGSAMC